MTEPRTIEQHGSRIIAALERAWAAIQDQHPDVPDVVIVTGAGSNQKGTPEGYRLRGHHWPERWILDGQDRPRAPELFIAGRAAVGRGPRGRGGHAARGRPRPGHPARHQGHQRRRQPLPQQAVRRPRGRAGPARPGRARQDHRLVGLHPHRPGRLRRLCRRRRRDRHAPGSRSWSTWPARAAPAAVEAAARTRATARPARRPSAADGGSPSSAPASPSPGASSSHPSRSKTGRSSAACAAPRSSCPKTRRRPGLGSAGAGRRAPGRLACTRQIRLISLSHFIQ